MKTARRHWFFDFDGTLARTGEDIILAWKKTIADMGLSCPHFDEVFRIGPTLEKMAYELFDGATPELVAELAERFRTVYDESGFPNTVPYPGVPERLSALKESGAKIYIVTNKRHAATQKIVNVLGWENLFDGVWSFDSFPGVKYKKPELLARLLGELGVSPSDAVMVGDTKGDIDAGKANGVHTIGVTWGYGSREELSEADEICELN
jgi:phosphoglycolate phosphatase